MDWEEIERGLVRRGLEDAGVMATLATKLPEVTDPNLNWVWSLARETYETTGEPPSKAVFKVAIESAPEQTQAQLLEEVIRVYRTPIERKPLATLRALLQRKREHAALDGVQKYLTHVDRGDQESAIRALERGITAVDDASAPRAEPLVPKTWKTVKPMQRVPTGLKLLDDHIGGLARGEVGLILGTTGMGKSALTITIGQEAIAQYLRVLHIDTENGPQLTRARYISRMTGIPANQLAENQLGRDTRTRLDGWIERNYKRLADQFRVVYLEYDANAIGEVQAAIEHERAKGFHPDVVIFDSPDHLLMQGEQQRWEKFAGIANKLKGLAQKQKTALWFTSQADMAFEGKIAGARAVADSKQKVRVASVVVSVNQKLDSITKKAFGDEKCLYLAKSRSSSSRFTLPLQCRLETMHVTCLNEDGDHDDWEPGETVE
jgi:KaiC/GvpD/RAD55 family RecA-like ATPase